MDDNQIDIRREVATVDVAGLAEGGRYVEAKVAATKNAVAPMGYDVTSPHGAVVRDHGASRVRRRARNNTRPAPASRMRAAAPRARSVPVRARPLTPVAVRAARSEPAAPGAA
jgi:hypothetical protein